MSNFENWTTVSKNKNAASSSTSPVKTVYINNQSKQQNTVKTVYADINKVYTNTTTPSVVIANNYNKTSVPTVSTVPTVKKSSPLKAKTKKELYDDRVKSIDSAINDACIPESKLLNLLEEFDKYEQIRKCKSSKPGHLPILLLSYFDSKNQNRYPALSSQIFYDQVTEYYSQYDCSVSIVNDKDNEQWKITIYP